VAGESRLELVLTLPDLYGTPLYQAGTRTTTGVLTQIVAGARRRVVFAAPFMQAGYGLSTGPIQVAVEAALARGVSVEILGTHDGLATLDSRRLCRRSKSVLRLWEPSAHIQNPQRLGSHAKFCVVDGHIAYVGSANFTGPGLSSQLEVGLLTEGEVAEQIASFWDLACRTGIFVEVASFTGASSRTPAVAPR
jgi:phosphatidylserine/phosphatidylglycerophosphate/cardiolipin synthase-like enzyme